MTKRSMRRTFISLVALLLTVLVLVMMQSYWSEEEIPLPFGFRSSSFLKGQVTKIGEIDGHDIKKVTFLDTDSEMLAMNSVYIVSIPEEATIRRVPMDQALSVAGHHEVNFYGYKYKTPNAAQEKMYKGSPVFELAFPGQFLVSAEARVEDGLHGGAIAAFEAEHGITMSPTDGSPGSAFLEPNSLYFIIVNEGNPAMFTARPPIICGDGWRDAAGADGIDGNADDEQCDDDDTGSGDGCSATCQTEEGFSCSQGSPTVCIPYSCEETDSGVHYEVKGTKTETVNGAVSQNTDSCRTLAGVSTYNEVTSCAGANCYVKEYACLADGMFDSIARCRLGCSNGTCQNPVFCGDGIILDGEECDDGDHTSGDGCSNECEVEPGYACAGEPSVCSIIPV